MERQSKAKTGKKTFDTLCVECKTPATVILLLRSTEEEILVQACESVHTYADEGDENKVSLLELGAVEPLCRLIAHNNNLVRRSAFTALGNMATNGNVKDALKKANIIPLIIDTLSVEDAVIHEFATLCLSSMSVDFVCKAEIFNKEGLPPLIKLLSSSDPDVQKNSLETIYNLVEDYPSRIAVRELAGIPPVLDLLKSDFPIIQHLALKTLMTITTDRDTRFTFREQRGFERLMDILNNKDFSDLHAETLQVVANCLSDTECFQLIHKDGGLTKLVEFVLTPTMPEIQLSAIKCIAMVPRSSENCKLLHVQEVEKALVGFLSVEDESVKTAACQAIGAMSFYPASKNTFRDLGVVPMLVQFLSSESLLLREAATQALCDLTSNNKFIALSVYEAEGHEILVQLLSDSCCRTVASAAALLGNMAEQEAIRSGILAHGAIPALVEPLKSSDTQVLINTTQCLAVLACEADARTQLRSAGGLHPLVCVLRSNHKDVFDSACMAVCVCASDVSSAVEMCKSGALEILQEMNESENRRSRLSKLAMISLLNSNLSLKYSLTGCLASTDIITSGFYDAGKACAGQRVLSLEEYCKQPVMNQHRPIIAINTSRVQTEDDKQIDEDQPEPSTAKLWRMLNDKALQVLITQAKKSILPLTDEKEQYAALARQVSKAMGGAVEAGKLHEFPWELHLSELRFHLQSNVVPIGMINKGIYCHRALLFKCLADCIGISCTLVRGDYNRAWNEVLVFKGNPSSNRHLLLPCRFIVDLMHQPGSLLKVDTPAAVQYQTI